MWEEVDFEYVTLVERVWTEGGARIGGRMRDNFCARRGNGGAIIIVGSEDRKKHGKRGGMDELSTTEGGLLTTGQRRDDF